MMEEYILSDYFYPVDYQKRVAEKIFKENQSKVVKCNTDSFESEVGELYEFFVGKLYCRGEHQLSFYFGNDQLVPDVVPDVEPVPGAMVYAACLSYIIHKICQENLFSSSVQSQDYVKKLSSHAWKKSIPLAFDLSDKEKLDAIVDLRLFIFGKLLGYNIFWHCSRYCETKSSDICDPQFIKIYSEGSSSIYPYQAVQKVAEFSEYLSSRGVFYDKSKNRIIIPSGSLRHDRLGDELSDDIILSICWRYIITCVASSSDPLLPQVWGKLLAYASFSFAHRYGLGRREAIKALDRMQACLAFDPDRPLLFDNAQDEPVYDEAGDKENNAVCANAGLGDNNKRKSGDGADQKRVKCPVLPLHSSCKEKTGQLVTSDVDSHGAQQRTPTIEERQVKASYYKRAEIYITLLKPEIGVDEYDLIRTFMSSAPRCKLSLAHRAVNQCPMILRLAFNRLIDLPKDGSKNLEVDVIISIMFMFAGYFSSEDDFSRGEVSRFCDDLTRYQSKVKTHSDFFKQFTGENIYKDLDEVVSKVKKVKESWGAQSCS